MVVECMSFCIFAGINISENTIIRMRRLSVSVKVAAGYAVVLCIFCAASLFIYRYIRSAGILSEVERYVAMRSGVTTRFMFNVLEVENIEKMIILGNSGVLPEYERMLKSTKTAADSLKLLVDDPQQRLRTDSLKIILDEKYENTLRLLRIMSPANARDLYDEKLEQLRNGEDSVVIHHNAEKVTAEKKTTYVVEKTRRKFINRLADAFRRQKTDTTEVLTDTHITSADTVSQALNVGDTIADMISDIKQKDKVRRSVRRTRYIEQGDALRLAGAELSVRMRQLLDNITTAEQRWFRDAASSDIALRRTAMQNIGVLAAVAVLLALIFLFFILRDISRANNYRVRLEEARNHAETLLEQRERLLLTVTHDIKSPASSISGFAEMLRACVCDGKASEYIACIRSSTAHLLQLVGALQDYHALENGRMTVTAVDFSPYRLLHDCTESFRPAASQKNLTLRHNHISDASQLFRGDAFRIRQIAENLIGNAIKYTREGSIDVTSEVASGMLHLSVADTGIGMTPDESRRVFNAFTRLSGAQGEDGVGLGLSITRELVTLLGGTIRLESSRGNGTTFFVSLPLEPADISADDNIVRITDAPAATTDKSISILVIDDDAMQLKLMGDMLARLSCGKWHITLCSRIEEMFANIEKHRYDIVFTDIEMPGMNGFEIAGRIGSPLQPVVAVTAHASLSVSDFEEAGFASCLFKPFTVGHLSKVIAKVTGISFSDIHLPSSPIPDGTFSALTAFADGDPDAEHDILNRFREDTLAHAAVFRHSLDTFDFSAIPGLAHKLIPVFTMIQSPAATLLRRLADMRHEKSLPADVADMCRRVLAEMERTVSMLDDV